MNRTHLASFVIVSMMALLSGLPLWADVSDVPSFSADMIQKGPQGTTKAKVYVSKGRMRTDMARDGKKIIHIVDNSKHVQWMLYPAQRVYMERPVPGQAPMTKPAEKNPCALLKNAKCKNLGHEKVAGRDAIKWAITFAAKGKNAKGMQWIDVERGMPLRMEMPGGQKSEMKFLGMEKLNGRTVEKWELLSSQGSNPPQRTYQWYDPRLKLAVREEFPGGFVREMINIREGVQPDDLFTLPAGYKKMAPAPAGGGMPPRARAAQ